MSNVTREIFELDGIEYYSRVLNVDDEVRVWSIDTVSEYYGVPHRGSHTGQSRMIAFKVEGCECESAGWCAEHAPHE